MLNDSRLYSFLDSKNNYGVHFLEGQKFIQDLALLHQFNGPTFNYFRDTLLTFQQMMSFLKPGEMFGFYIDSEKPHFRFKLEASYHGKTRALIIPDQLEKMPTQVTGKARLLKMSPGSGTPYSSIVELKNHSISDTANEILTTSYQTQSKIILSSKTDQSILIRKLPQLGGHKITTDEVELKDYVKNNEDFFRECFEKNLNDVEGVVNAFEKGSLAYLHSMEVSFHCSCSQEQMVQSIRSLSLADVDYVFGQDDQIESTCDYCKKVYVVKKDEIGS